MPQTIQCPACGVVGQGEDGECADCGRVFRTPPGRCVFCGSDNPAGSLVCHGCYAHVRPVQPLRRWSQPLGLLVGIALIGGVSWGGLHYGTTVALPFGPTATPTQVPTLVALVPLRTITPAPTKPPATATRVPTPTPIVHRIRPGDTLLGIAQQFEVTLEALEAANPGISPRILQIDQDVIIPAKPAPTPAAPAVPAAAAPAPTPAPSAPELRKYTIRSGDTPLGIANRNDVTLEQLEQANPGISRRTLHIGEEVVIPATSASATPAAAPAPKTTVYTVRSGDTPLGIAIRHDISLNQLIQANPEARSALASGRLSVGQELQIPGQ